MYLKSLTLRGFKSFASATTLAFEPGVTCVVGPNGSGKSNVVDALAWVMGEQGAKTLRGGKMEDVIFAGTQARAPLGRAEVSLTIDNSDGALPIEYSEVTIKRTMFRSGGSEYAINGAPARLLDVQELLSDSGIGREMHVIVGQGQLDAILHATAEERRGFVEEAAGVLKHRKRKERAVRKLEAMSANLNRVSDLANELRRQLAPLGRQAEAARRAGAIQAELRDASLRLLADELAQQVQALESGSADDSGVRAQAEAVAGELAGAREREAALEAESVAGAPHLRSAQDTWLALSALRERMAGTISLARDRQRSLAAQPAGEDRGRDPAEMAQAARRMRAQEAELAAGLAAQQAALAQAVADRTAAEAENARADATLRAAARALADRREGLARLIGQVGAARSRVEARGAEIARLEAAIAAAKERATAAGQQFAALETSIVGLDAGEEDLDGAYERAADHLAALDGRIAELIRRETDLERGRAGLLARADALAEMAAAADGSAALRSAGLPGIVGPLAGCLRVAPGYERAVAAALGPLAEAVVASGWPVVAGAFDWLAQHEAGRTAFVVAGVASPSAHVPADALTPGARWASSLVELIGQYADDLAAPLATALAGVAVVADTEDAIALASARPELVVVTRAGDLAGRGVAAGGTPGPPGSLELAADAGTARERLSGAEHDLQRIRFELSGLRSEREGAAAGAADALAALHDSDARMAAVAEQLGAFGAAVRAANAEADRLGANLQASRAALAADGRTLAELEQRLAGAQDAGADEEPSTQARDHAAAAAQEARRVEVEVRLALRTAQERARAVTGRAEQLERAAAAESAARARAAVRQERLARAGALCAQVAAAAEQALTHLDETVAVAQQQRDAAEADRVAAQVQMRELRTRIRALESQAEQLTSAAHREELARAQQRLRLEALAARAMDEYGLAGEDLVAQYGPHLPVPGVPDAPEAGTAGAAGSSQASGQRAGGDPGDGEQPQSHPYVRAEQERRAKAAQKALAALGRVNPLALEEFAALEERHRFLTEQLADLKGSRRDLLGLIGDVDRRVEEVFASAFADTAVAFEAVFARLFPGGEGRLVLTDPESMLTTGIEVQARPPGKKVKRLSLLSGGERSLTAVAFLVALFKARPSPFYVLDEVEAALDDVNLGRLLDVIEELRADSQLIVITHQKRTMEVADALYGVSMRGDGVTAVISQRLRERPAPA